MSKSSAGKIALLSLVAFTLVYLPESHGAPCPQVVEPMPNDPETVRRNFALLNQAKEYFRDHPQSEFYFVVFSEDESTVLQGEGVDLPEDSAGKTKTLWALPKSVQSGYTNAKVRVYHRATEVAYLMPHSISQIQSGNGFDPKVACPLAKKENRRIDNQRMNGPVKTTYGCEVVALPNAKTNVSILFGETARACDTFAGLKSKLDSGTRFSKKEEAAMGGAMKAFHSLGGVNRSPAVDGAPIIYTGKEKPELGSPMINDPKARKKARETERSGDANR
jgi:hypothetical protein